MTDPALPETCWSGRRPAVWIRPGRAVYIGPSLDLREHSGAVHCFALGVSAPFTIRVGADEGTVRSALIPARTRHLLVADAGRILFAYVDPGSGWARQINDRMTATIGTTVRCGLADELALARRIQHLGSADPMALLGIDDTAARHQDERIGAALTILRRDPQGRLSAPEVARMVHLSSSRFQHLFTAHTGTSFRRYRSWSRILRVANAVAGGNDLTTASADAGFASPGHFSDTFRALFGLSATQLLNANVEIHAFPEPAEGN